MSAIVSVTITLPNSGDTIPSVKSRIFKLNPAGNPIDDQFTAVRRLIQLLEGAEVGAYSAAIQITVRDTDPSVSTSGTGSVQATYNLK